MFAAVHAGGCGYKQPVGGFHPHRYNAGLWKVMRDQAVPEWSEGRPHRTEDGWQNCDEARAALPYLAGLKNRACF